MGEILEFEKYIVELREYLVTIYLKKKIFINSGKHTQKRENLSSNICNELIENYHIFQKFKEKVAYYHS